MNRKLIAAAVALGIISAGLHASEPEHTGIQCQPVLLVQVGVSDLDKSIAFYTEKLGFELESVHPEIEWARIKTGIQGVTIGLGRQDQVAGSGTVSMNFGVANIDEARGILEPQGVEFDGPNVTVPGVIRLATLFDPDGNRIRLASPPGAKKRSAPKAAPEDSERSIRSLGWIAGTWRGELFGSQAEERWSAPAGHHMLGVFHLWTDEGPSVYELLEISESETDAGENKIFLRFKHFNVGTLEPWEKDEPLEFLLTELDGQRALFTATSEEQRVVTSMEYRREKNELRVRVIGEHENGEAFEFIAEFTLQQD